MGTSYRVMGGFLAVWYALVAAGIPTIFPRAPSALSTEERFPCENCACGCVSADQCWESCCCHSLAERLAWAQRTGVQPPQHALMAAKRAGIPTAGTSSSTPHEEDCICRGEMTSQLATCGCCSDSPKTPAGPPSRPRGPQTIMLRAMACQGLTLAWLSTGAVELPAVWTLPVDRSIREVSVAPPEQYHFLLRPPPTPPPQVRDLAESLS